VEESVNALGERQLPAARRRDYRVILLTADTVAGALALAGLLLWAPPSWFAAPRAPLAVGILFLAWISTLFLRGQYTLYPWHSVVIKAQVLLRCVLTATILGAGLVAILPWVEPLPAPVYLISAGLMLPLTLAIRLAAVRYLPREMVNQRYLLLADGETSAAFWRSLNRVPLPRHVEIVGAVTVNGKEDAAGLDGLPLLGDIQALPETVRRYGVQTVILSGPRQLSGEHVRLIMECEEMGTRVLSSLSAHEEITQRTPLFLSNGIGEISLETVQHSKYATRLKRVLDVLVTVLLLPPALVLMGVAALLVLLTDGFPVLYRQQRVGEGGRPFTLLKIRTMVRDAEADTGAVWATKNDPRVISVGRFLRATRLDELPQLFNILHGDMSLVGPRPERPEFVQEFLRKIPHYGQRLLVRPGLTGWAQVNHNYDRDEEDVYEKLRYDLYYLRHLSFTLDLQILLATIGVVFSRSGAH